jgi:TRAP-type uncharacterized transport system substrate-binding protein
MDAPRPAGPAPASRRRRALLLAAGALAAALAVVAIASYARPRVPRTVAMATGFRNGTAHRFALDYRAILARHGVELQLRESRGAPENLALLEDSASGVGAAFLQSGTLTGGRRFTEGLRESIAVEHPDLVALGSLFHEPLWVFHRLGGEPETFADLAGTVIAVGGPGTAGHALVAQLLPAGGLPFEAFTPRELGGPAAVKALLAGEVDVVMFPAHEGSPLVAELAAAPGVTLMSLAHADAFVRRFPWLARLTLPRGALDLARDLPARDVALVSPIAQLVVRRDLHPTIQLLLLEAAKETHSEAGTFQRLGQFPSVEHLELPIEPGAQAYVTEGPSFLERHLPFRAAAVVRRLTLLLPAIALLVSVLKYAPQAHAWWVSQRIYRWYGELRTIEDELDRAGPDADLAAYGPRVDEVDRAVSHLATPVRWSDRVYILRQHVDFVRARVETLRRERKGG